MSPLRTLLAWIVLLFVVAGPAGAHDSASILPDYIVTTWSDKDGMPSGRIWAIEQDADGYLWIGTDTGVVRFDGTRFATWESLGLPTLPHGSVLTLLAAKDRSLWIGFGVGGVARLRDRRVQVYGDPRDVGQAYAYSLMEDHQAGIWVVSRDGLHRFANEGWKSFTGRDGLPSGKEVLAVYEDRARNLWVATRDAVWRRRAGQPTFEQVDAIEEATMLYPWFSEDPAGRVWVTDFRHGFKQVGERPASARERDGLGVNLLHDRSGDLWVATQGQGLWRVPAEKANTPAPYRGVQMVTARDGLPSDGVSTLFEDREGNVWVGLNSGLQRYSRRKVTTLITSGVPGPIAAAPDGSVWLGTSNGLTRFSRQDTRQYDESDGLPGAKVLDVHIGADGRPWAVTVRGLVRYDRGRFVPVTFPGVEKIGRLSAVVNAGDTTWFHDIQRGIFRLRDGVLSHESRLPDAFQNRIFDIHLDRKGTLWVSSLAGQVGALGLDGNLRTYQLPIGNVSTIFEDRDGVIWVGGRSGLGRFVTDRFITVGRQNGFPESVISLVEDKDGVLWVAAETGIVRLEKTEFDKGAADPQYQVRYAILDTSDGTAGSPFYGRAHATRDADGQLWFVTGGGLTIVNPATLKQNAPLQPLTTVIEAVTANGRPFIPAEGLDLPSRSTHLQIDYTALDLTHPSRVRFRYRLDGVDTAWINAGNNRRATYTNLSAGTYRFRVAAMNGSDGWTEAGTHLDFSIAPTFYQTRSFYAACLVAVALSVWTVWRLRLRQVRRQFALVLAERIRMSRAIHDTLLQGLAGLALQFDHLAHGVEGSAGQTPEAFARLRRQIEEYMREARNSIWDLRSPMLSQRDLVTALKSTGERLVAGTPVEFQFHVNGTPHACPSRIEEQLLSIAQEALSNAVRHSNARHVKLNLNYDDHRVGVKVADDGCGFDVDTARKAQSHYGLITMQERADAARAYLNILTSPGRGTEIEVVAPIPGEG